MRDHKRWIDLALLDPFEQGWKVMLDGRLRHTESQATIDCRAHRDFVEEAAIYADDRDGAEVAAAMNRLPQHMRPIRAHEGRHLDAINYRIEAGRRVGLGADRSDVPRERFSRVLGMLS